MDLKCERNLMLFNLSAMTQNPLSCMRSSPVLDLRFPVDRKNYKALPIIPFSSVFLIRSEKIQ